MGILNFINGASGRLGTATSACRHQWLTRGHPKGDIHRMSSPNIKTLEGLEERTTARSSLNPRPFDLGASLLFSDVVQRIL